MARPPFRFHWFFFGGRYSVEEGREQRQLLIDVLSKLLGDDWETTAEVQWQGYQLDMWCMGVYFADESPATRLIEQLRRSSRGEEIPDSEFDYRRDLPRLEMVHYDRDDAGVDDDAHLRFGGAMHGETQRQVEADVSRHIPHTPLTWGQLAETRQTGAWIGRALNEADRRARL